MSAPILWTAAEAAAATGGGSPGDWSATGVSIDTRTIAKGDLFVALKGPVFDGHDFVADALRRGAAAALVSRAVDAVPADAPLLTTADTMAALEALAKSARERSKARIVAVTGSVGKTGTKEALRHALEGQGLTTASQSSLNNQWGVPLSLSRMPKQARYGIFEIGMNHAGEITPLTQLVRPHVAVITTVEAAHTEFFHSVEEIADAKAEIFLGMDGAGIAVLNRDNPHFDRLAAAAGKAGIGRIVGFGEHSEAEVRLIAATTGGEGTRVTADIAGETLEYLLGAPGRHWAINSLAVLAALRSVDADVAAGAAALARLRPLDGRGRTHRISLPTGDITLIDESYNANPASMRAAIATLAGTPLGGDGRRIAVLGEMRELGAQSSDMHAGLAETLVRQGIDLVFTAGADMAHLNAALPAKQFGGTAESGDALAPALLAALTAGDVVMVKGSNASGMKTVVDALLSSQLEASRMVKA